MRNAWKSAPNPTFISLVCILVAVWEEEIVSGQPRILQSNLRCRRRRRRKRRIDALEEDNGLEEEDLLQLQCHVKRWWRRGWTRRRRSERF